jgi:hypothetical protein
MLLSLTFLITKKQPKIFEEDLEVNQLTTKKKGGGEIGILN